MARRKKSELSADDKILTEAMERYEDCQTSCTEIYKDAADDMRFSAGDQWSADTTRDRIDRPVLTENRLASSLHQVCNAQRMNRPMIHVSPKKEMGDAEVAEIVNGFLRHIQYLSDSESAVDWAFECAARAGIGWFRITTRYEDDRSFDQTISIDRISNFEDVKIPFHLCHEIDMRDMPYGFVESTVSRDEFEERYPDADLTGWKTTVTQAGWLTDKTVRICEYFVVEENTSKLHKLSDGSTVTEIPVQIEGMPPVPTVIASRDVPNRKIKWYKMTAGNILERGEFPGRWIPLIPVIGEEVLIGGKRKFYSFLRHAKDPQKMLNYWRSSICERIALATKGKWVVASTQIENYENEWLNSNRSNNILLHYDPVVEGGVLVPPPQPTNPVQADMALIQAANEAVDAIKACCGVFDASLGANGPEKSGLAINARQRQTDSGTFHFYDNLAKSLRHAGRIVVDLIPEVIDTPRALKILGEDQKPKIVLVNQMHGTSGKIYDLTVSEYDVLVETGPSFMSKQAETAAHLRDLSNNDPVLIQSTRDLVMRYMGMPTEVIERVAKTIDPQLLDNGQGDNPLILKSQIAKQNQVLQQLDAVIQMMTKELDGYKAKTAQHLATNQLDNETRLAIAKLQAQVQVLLAGAKLEDKHIDRAHETGMASMQHVHNITQGQLQQSAPRTSASTAGPAPSAESESAGE